MSEKFRLDRKIGFQNTFNTKCINVIIDSIGPSIILRSIYVLPYFTHCMEVACWHTGGGGGKVFSSLKTQGLSP